MSGTKCWNCARLARCDDARICNKPDTCNDFIPYIRSVTLPQMAILCGTSASTLSRYLRASEDYTVAWIFERCGIRFTHEKVNTRASGFKLKSPNSEAYLQLYEKLEAINAIE